MEITKPNTSTLGLRHALLVFTTPSALFRRIEDTGAYGWALLTLLLAVTLLGYVQVQSGLIDRVVDQQTDKRLAEVERTQLNLVDRAKLREVMADIRKAGDFAKILSRLQVVILSPIVMLASFLIIAALLYAVVALTGRKPEYHTLMSICVYAGFIELIAHLVRVGMMLYYERIDVDTSLGMLAQPGAPTVLVALDPFRIWFWILVAMGLTITRQLSRRMALVICSVMCLSGMGIAVAAEFAIT